jgi:hypothetical protein
MNGARWRAATAGLALAAGLGACSDDPEPQPSDRSPLAEFPGFDISSNPAGVPEISPRERQRQLAMEEVIAACMRDAGFEYLPVSTEDRMAGGLTEAYSLDPKAFAERYGYGVTTLTFGADANTFVDPNQEIRDGLSGEQREAYDRAMWGDVASGDADQEDPTALPSGCQMQATTEVYQGTDDGFSQFDSLFDELGALYSQIGQDSRLAAAHRLWADCMAGAGYPDLTEPADAEKSVFDRMSGIASSAEGSDLPADPLADLREYELALAPADQACQQEHVAGPRGEVTTELEERFIEEHREELESYREWLDRARADGGTG